MVWWSVLWDGLLQAFFLQILIRFFVATKDLPMLHTHQGDGTPGTARLRTVTRMGDFEVRRAGQQAVEYYNCRSHYLALSKNGCRFFAKKFIDPVPMDFTRGQNG